MSGNTSFGETKSTRREQGWRKLPGLLALLLICALALLAGGLTLSGCGQPEEEDIEYYPRAEDMKIDGFRMEMLTTGTIENILVAQWGYLFEEEQQMELYNVRMVTLEPMSDPDPSLDPSERYNVARVITAASAVYYLRDKTFPNGVLRNQGDIDLMAKGNWVIVDEPQMRLEARDVYYEASQNKFICKDRYRQYQHELQSISGTLKGFSYKVIGPGETEIERFPPTDPDLPPYTRKSLFDAAGKYLGPDPREIPKP